MDSENNTKNTVINMSVLVWCLVVIIELVILACIIPSPAAPCVLLIGLVLYSPITAAFKWRAPKELDTPKAKKAK